MNNTGKVLVVVGATLAIGATLGILFAPDEGTATRKKIAKRAKKLSGTVSDTLDQGMDSLAEIKATLEQELQKVNRKIEELMY